jgi:hypothetical protein
VFRRQPVAVATPILGQIYAELDAARMLPRPSWHRRLRSWLWVRRRSAGLPLAVFAAVWLAGQGVRLAAPVAGWWLPLAVAAAGWAAVVTAWYRAKGAHLPHTMATVVFIAAWLFLVALDAG